MARGRRYKGPISKEAFATVIDAYMDSDKYKSLAPHTRATYRRFLLLAADANGLGAISVDLMRPALIQAFLDGLADRPAAQQKARTVMAAVERWAIVRDLLPRQITTGTEAPGGDGGHVPWSDEYVGFAEAMAVSHLARVITIAANSGQRGSDLSRMRWTDIETIESRPGINVIQQKTGLRIWIPFTQILIAKMATWERRPGFILTKADGHPFVKHQLTDAWIREREKPGLEPLRHLVLHGLRGTAVVRLRRAGATIPQISDMVGMSEQMVRRYCRFSEQRENALAAVHMLDSAAARKLRRNFNET